MSVRCVCGKVRYASARNARTAHRGAGYRVKAYRCSKGSGWHVAASEKSTAETAFASADLGALASGRRLTLAPVRTLSEVDVLAHEKRGATAMEHMLPTRRLQDMLADAVGVAGSEYLEGVSVLAVRAGRGTGGEAPK